MVLALVLGSWLGARVILWSSPFAMSGEKGPVWHTPVAASPLPPAAPGPDLLQWRPDQVLLSTWPIRQQIGPRVSSPQHRPYLTAGPLPEGQIWTLVPTVPPSLDATDHIASVALVLQTQPQSHGLSSPAAPPETSAERSRWWVDGWALWREGSGFARAPSTSLLSGYGGSQAGAMVRYRFTDQSPRDPFAYARVSRALVEGGEAEVAVGIGARPILGLPLTLQGELRLTDARTRALVRPVILAVTEFPVARITERIEAEAYVQAGYIGGDYATGFADGQARIDRRMAKIGSAELRLGAGAWGGAQEGATRLDVGPTASVKFDLGKVPVRLSVDYRTRVAGDAAPDSGVAVTIVGGF